jgi:hypothetical protein
MSYEYSVAALVAAHTAFRDLVDGETGNAKILIRDSAEVLLAEIVLNDPCGTVAAGTGQLTLGVLTQEDDAPASGTADHAELVDGAGAVHLTLPCQQGSSAVSGACVLSSLAVVAGGDVNLISAVIG